MTRELISNHIENCLARTDCDCMSAFFNCIAEEREQAQMNLFQLDEHHEVGDNSTEHTREQIQRYGEEFRPGNCHCFLTLLANDLNECLCFLRAVVPVARVGCFHH